MKKCFSIINLFLIMLLLSSCKSNVVSIENIDVNTKTQEVKEVNVANDNNLLISYDTTSFDPSDYGRTTNIELAANYINGIILKPDEEFSFNSIVGKRTKEKGFQEADIYINTNGEIVTKKSLGGGICQVSTTICKAVLKTPMTITERNVHSKSVTYASREEEAMINWGTSDFRFINNYDFPIKIEISLENKDGIEDVICKIFKVE